MCVNVNLIYVPTMYRQLVTFVAAYNITVLVRPRTKD